jgi:hypothetical protein
MFQGIIRESPAERAEMLRSQAGPGRSPRRPAPKQES